MAQQIVNTMEISLEEDSSRLMHAFIASVDDLKNTMGSAAKEKELYERIAAATELVTLNSDIMDREGKHQDLKERDSFWLIDQVMRKLLDSEYTEWRAGLVRVGRYNDGPLAEE